MALAINIVWGQQNKIICCYSTQYVTEQNKTRKICILKIIKDGKVKTKIALKYRQSKASVYEKDIRTLASLLPLAIFRIFYFV